MAIQERLVIVLMHFLWQGAVVATGLVLLTALLRLRRPGQRYALSLAAFVVMSACPLATWWLVDVAAHPQAVRSSAVITLPPIELSGLASPDPIASAMVPPRSVDEGGQPIDFEIASENAEASEFNAPRDPISPIPMHAFVDSPLRVQLSVPAAESSLMSWLRPFANWIVGAWLAGVAVMTLRLLMGAVGTWFWRRDVQELSGEIAERLRGLCDEMSMRVPCVRLSRRVSEALVVGLWRPMVLLPVSWLSELPPDMLEAILAHELAHLRRFDLWVNLGQRIVETLLFYHPAVWWLSHRLRIERELCCDAVVVATTRDPIRYAETLEHIARLERRPVISGLSIAIGGSNGVLLRRIRQLLGIAQPGSTSGAWFASLVACGLAVFVGSGAWGITKAENQPVNPEIRAEKNGPDAAEAEPHRNATEDSPNAAVELAVTKAIEVGKSPEAAKPSGLRRIVRIVDAEGLPIPGAAVQALVELNGRVLTEDLNESVPVTDSEGQVAFDVPMRCKQIYIKVTADGFVEFEEHQQAIGSSIIQLNRGRIITVKAVDPEGNVLKKAIPFLEKSRFLGGEFAEQLDGTRKSPTVSLERRLLRIVGPHDGTLLFSDLTDVDTAPRDEDDVLHLELKPGTRLVGRLDDSVPRPISEGYANLRIAEGARHQIQADGWTWEDFTPIQPDGSFVFESLPGGGHAQLSVIADGYVSQSPPLEKAQQYFRQHKAGNEELIKDAFRRSTRPQLVPLDQQVVSVEVPCEPTASCEIRVLDPSGNPLSDALVIFNPQALYFDRSGFTLGFTQAYAILARNGGALAAPNDMSRAAVEERQRRDWLAKSFWRVSTNADGVAQIRNLPGDYRESFDVRAGDMVMPEHPSIRHSNGEGWRAGTVELINGQTVKRTVYMEYPETRVDRELLVVNAEGRPLRDIQLTLTELRVGADDWQIWSTRRFGDLSKQRTDDNGRVVLKSPTTVDGKPVERLRIAVDGKFDGLWAVLQFVEVPLEPEQGFIALSPDPDPDRAGSAIAVYRTSAEAFSAKSSLELRQQMIKQPNLSTFAQILKDSGKPLPRLVHFLNASRSNDEKGGLAGFFDTPQGRITLFLAKVDPSNSGHANLNELDTLPDAAFLFDANGQLLKMIGGTYGSTGGGSPDHVDVVCFGRNEDWFIRVQRFEQNQSFDYLTESYRIADPIVPSLRFYHFANSTGWFNAAGPRLNTPASWNNLLARRARMGALSFDFNRWQREASQTGVTRNGATVVRQIIWDGIRDRFLGAPFLSVDGKPLYQVDTEWSKDFEPLTPNSDQIIISDTCEQGYLTQHWTLAIPDKSEAQLRLTIPQRSAPALVFDKKLKPGGHLVWLSMGTDLDSEERGQIVNLMTVMLGGKGGQRR